MTTIGSDQHRPGQTKNLISELENLAKHLGVDLLTYGYIGNKPLFYRPENESFLRNRNMLWSISLAVHYAESVVDLLALHEDEGMLFYFKQHNQSRSEMLEKASQEIATFLSDHGCRAFVIPGRGKGYSKGTPGIISHIALANLSGMGTMGDCGLLITPEYGPRIRLCSILTDLELPVRDTCLPDQCIHCGLCQKACPAGAIYGGHFDPKHPEKPYIDSVKCSSYRSQREKTINNRFCNLCMMVCPVGKHFPLQAQI